MVQETDLEAKLARTERELSEALERETATSEVLRVISSSPDELGPVFEIILANATRLCEAIFGNLYLCDGGAYRMVAAHHDSPAYVEARTRDPLLRPPPDTPLGRLAITRQVAQVADIRTLPSRDHPFVAAGVAAGYRTVLAIPLLKNDELIGAFTMIRQEVRPFTDKQVELLTNFAAQAVIVRGRYGDLAAGSGARVMKRGSGRPILPRIVGMIWERERAAGGFARRDLSLLVVMTQQSDVATRALTLSVEAASAIGAVAQ